MNTSMDALVLARHLRKGDKLWLFNSGRHHLVTINRIWHGHFTTVVDYTNGTNDIFGTDKDVTNAYIAGRRAGTPVES